MAVNRRRKQVMHWLILLSLLFASEVRADTAVGSSATSATGSTLSG